jgi:hypothetical protein
MELCHLAAGRGFRTLQSWSARAIVR